MRKGRRNLLGTGTMAAALTAGLVVMAPAAHAATGSARISAAQAGSFGFASATWTWSGPGRLTNIDLHVSDDECNSNPVYVKFRVTRTNGATWTTGTGRYDYNGCSGNGTVHPDLSLSDDFNIRNVALVLCNERTGVDQCYTGPNSGNNPLA
ncbi:hypothetical protein ACIQVC_14235 [Streptomyces sp. NPDC101112]|uniref:hypothetical protein n=1 Tax=unclassified Streptomyces TaxID=2593676 RepID=UPI00117CF8BB|nr:MULTISPECIES: hypothetical protein [unclassified Streptomyces]